MAMSSISIFQFGVYIAIAVVGSTGHIATLTVLATKNAIRRNTFDRTTHRLMLHMSSVSLIFCAVGMPLRAWNMAVGAKWPFNSTLMLTFEHYSVFVLLYVPTLLMTALTLTRFTATFYAHKHERWMRKFWVQLCLHLIPYILPFGWFTLGGNSVLGIFKFTNAPGTGLAFPLPVNNTPAERQLYRIFNVLQIVLNCFIPITLECVVYVAIFCKLYVSSRKRRRISTGGTVAAENNTVQSTAQSLQPTGGARSAAAPRENSVANAHAHLYGTNTKKILQKRKVVSQQNKARLQQLRTIKVLAAVYCTELLLAFPNKFLFAVGLKEVIGAKWPAVSIVFELLSFVMYACTPLVFARSSAEMGQAYKRLVYCVVGGCCCGRCVPPTRLALAANNVTTRVNTQTNQLLAGPAVSVGGSGQEPAGEKKSEEILPRFTREPRQPGLRVKISDGEDRIVLVKRQPNKNVEEVSPPNAVTSVTR